MFKIKNKYLLFLLYLNTVLGSGILSNLDNLSLYSSYSLFSYKEDFISESLELVNTRPHYSNISIGLIYNRKYELRFSHVNNSNSNNIYSLPFKDEFISMDIAQNDGKDICRNIRGVGGLPLLTDNEKYHFRVMPKRENVSQ